MDKWGDIYKSIGAKPIINAIGSVTLLGGSTPIKEVKEAMDQADSAYVPLMELQEKADIVSLHTPLTAETLGMVDLPFLEKRM